MSVNRLDLPAVALETLRRILTACELGSAFDGDGIAVEQIDKFPKTEMSGEGCRLVGDPLHQVSIADQRIGEMIDELVLGSVKSCGQQTFGKGEADGIGGSLSQRPGRRLDSGSIAVFGVSRGHRTPLSEVPQLFKLQIVAAKMEHGVDQHRAVSRREYETVSIGPSRRFRVKFETAGEERVGQVGTPHRQPGVS